MAMINVVTSRTDAGLAGVPFATRRDFRCGAFLAEAECPADTVYLLAEGQVRCFLLSEDGCEATTAVLGPRQLVGVLGLFGFPTHPVFAEALGSVRAWAMPAEGLRNELRHNPMLQGLVIGALAQRLALAEGLLRDVLLLPVRERVRDIERRLAATLGGKPAALRRAQLAALAQTRPETLARVSPRRNRLAVEELPDEARPCTRLFRAGETLDGLDAARGWIYQLMEGRLRVALGGKGKRELTVYTLEAGDFLDFSGLVGLPPNGLRAIGLTHGAIRAISAAQFMANIAESGIELVRIGYQLSRRLTWVDRQLSYAATRTVRGRVLAQLRDVDGGGPPTSHASLAKRVGASRETITRTLGQLEREGLISRERRRLRLDTAKFGVAQDRPQQDQHRARVHDAARDPHDQSRELLVVNR